MNEIKQRDYLEDPLWARISEYPFDDPKASYPFSEKLADEQFWLTSFTARVLDEYRKFIYLYCISPRGASPSKKIDEAWHLHLTYTVDYWQRFCKETLEQEIHHYPSTGGDVQKEKYDNLYRDTLKLYEQVFRAQPPADIWDQPPGVDLPADVVHDGMFSLRKHKLKYLLLLPILIIGILFRTVNPFALAGPDFLAFYAMLGVTTMITTVLLINVKKQRLSQVLNRLLEVTDKFDLAYLAGGRDRFILSCLCDLIETGYLTYIENGRYQLSNNFRDATHNPATKYLHALENEEHYTLPQLVAFFTQAYNATATRFSGLVSRFYKTDLTLILPALTAGIALARLIQGIANGKPVDFLVMMSVAFVFAAVMVHKFNDFHNAFRSVLNRNTVTEMTSIDSKGLDVIFAGMYGLAGIIAAEQLVYVYGILDRKPESGLFSYSGGDGGGCGSGGGCGGGGCGGGCGGCGGGGD